MTVQEDETLNQIRGSGSVKKEKEMKYILGSDSKENDNWLDVVIIGKRNFDIDSEVLSLWKREKSGTMSRNMEERRELEEGELVLGIWGLNTDDAQVRW